MEPQIRNLVDISSTAAALQGHADILLERARWATTVFQRYDRQTTMNIVDAVAKTAHENAAYYAEWAVRETGFGVVEHKKLKNELTAYPLVDYYRDEDYVNFKIDEARKIVEIPRPAGVVFALTPSTNPIATVNYKIIIALMTRNAIVISPHPAARECCVDAANKLAAAAVAAGAPEGVIQIIDKPTIPLVETFMASEKTNVILATGGTAMVRAAYSSSNPAIGVGPGNAPVFVDSSADVVEAAKHIVNSKSFDNSILCTNESVLITLPEIEKQLIQALRAAHAYICDEDDVTRLRRLLFHERGFNIECIGRDATWIANECGIRVPGNTRILIAPITHIGVEEKLSREKLCPVLAMHVASNRNQAIALAKATLRMTGAGHSAAIHAQDEQVTIKFANSVEVYRVVVNAPCSQGAAGYETHLPPTFTIGTGYFGRSSVGENIGPHHLVHWTRMAYNTKESMNVDRYRELSQGFNGPLPTAPSDGVPGSASARRVVTATVHSQNSNQVDATTREQIRRIIAEELRDILKK
ncbi:MAG: aldehyde dehydrogenase [marine bacterium B5-7]|nr:MAG: aldehyde dehydrogenase [marine bacterium B5-7]